MFSRILAVLSLTALVVFAGPVVSHDYDRDDDVKRCPVASPYTDASGNTLSFTDMFGAGVIERMNCLQKREKVKVVMQINAFVDSKGRPIGIRNLPNMIKDYEITNGMERGEDYEIALVIHGGGLFFALDPNATNPHPMSAMTANTVWNGKSMDQWIKAMQAQGVKVYFCLNTAAAKGIKVDQVLPGIEFVSAGLTAIADMQSRGYRYIQP